MSQFKIFDPPDFGAEKESQPTDEGTFPLKAIGVVVCRLDSTRLPGKVLRTVKGRPLLKWVVDRSDQVKGFDLGVVVATTNRTIDDPIAEFCNQQNIPVFRGSAEDVAGRVLKCAKDREANWFARINADSPFVEPDLLDKACRLATSDQFDLITNLSPRSFPYGVSTELIRTSTFDKAYQLMTSSEHFEHVTKILYEPNCPIEFRKFNILNADYDQSQVRLTVDTREDWQTFCQIVEPLEGDISFRQAIQLIQPSKGAA